MATIQYDMRLALLHVVASSSSSSSSSSAIRSFTPKRLLSSAAALRLAVSYSTTPFRLRAFSPDAAGDAAVKVDKPSICTADELHYVSVPNSDWKLALWRYHPPPTATKRNHPLLLLSGVGTNAIGYDLSPGSSFARYMSGQGFDTWILEVRGAGLSVHGSNTKEIENSAHEMSDQMEATSENATNGALPSEQQSNNDVNSLASEGATRSPEETDISVPNEEIRRIATVWDESKLVNRLTETLMLLSERLSGFLSESQSKLMSAKLLDQISTLLVDSQLSERFNEIRERALRLLETRQNSGLASQVKELSEKLVNIIEEGQRSVSPPLFDLQDRFSSTLEDFQKQLDLIVKYDWDFDHYLEEDIPAAALNVPVVPLGVLLSAAYPLSSSPPYALSWLNNLISAEDMMHPELLKKLVLNNFCTIPAKLLLQLRTAFLEGGLCDRRGKFFYKDHMHKTNVPILALAGDRDLICPPEAVEDTVKLIPEHLVTYKVFGEPSGPHYAHYDLVGGRLAVEQVYPCIIKFLVHHDST